MWQEWVVALLVFAALLYVLWRTMPKTLRQRLGRIHPKLAQKAGGCGSCGSCQNCPSASSVTRTPRDER